MEHLLPSLTTKIVWLKGHGTLLTMTWSGALDDSWLVGFTDTRGVYHDARGEMLATALDKLILELQSAVPPSDRRSTTA